MGFASKLPDGCAELFRATVAVGEIEWIGACQILCLGNARPAGEESGVILRRGNSGYFTAKSRYARLQETDLNWLTFDEFVAIGIRNVNLLRSVGVRSAEDLENLEMRKVTRYPNFNERSIKALKHSPEIGKGGCRLPSPASRLLR
jgi:hypothetical protein